MTEALVPVEKVTKSVPARLIQEAGSLRKVTLNSKE